MYSAFWVVIVIVAATATADQDKKEVDVFFFHKLRQIIFKSVLLFNVPQLLITSESRWMMNIGKLLMIRQQQ